LICRSGLIGDHSVAGDRGEDQGKEGSIHDWPRGEGGETTVPILLTNPAAQQPSTPMLAYIDGRIDRVLRAKWPEMQEHGMSGSGG
jgi:hypothetical protein